MSEVGAGGGEAGGDLAGRLDRGALGLALVEVVEVGDAEAAGAAGLRGGGDEREREREAQRAAGSGGPCPSGQVVTGMA